MSTQNTRGEFTSRKVLQSQERWTIAWKWGLEVLECLECAWCYSSMRLGVPTPRQLGAVGGQQGRQFLPSVGWRTGQSGAPPDNHCSCPVRDLLPILAQLTVADSWQLAHRTLSGAPCRPLARATRRPRIARPTVALATVGSPDSPVHHRTVRWIIAARRQTFPRVASSPEASLAHRTLSGAPPNSPVCQTELSIGCSESSPFLLLFSLFLALIQNMLVLKTMY
jgi:hypothetical protein